MIKKHTKRTLSILILAVILLTIIGITVFNIANTKNNNANAADKPQPYTTVELTKIADGTGFDENGKPIKANHTFIVSENGYKIADNTPDDGVVASGDTVEYNVSLHFQAAKNRQIQVKLESSTDFNNTTNGKSYLKTIGESSTFCQNADNISATWDENTLTCTYNIPTGYAGTVSGNILMRALDTNGAVIKNNQVRLTVTRLNGGATNIVNSSPITVVSAPMADLYLDNGADPHNRYTREGVYYLASNADITGSINIKTSQLGYNGWSSLGASTTGNWSSSKHPATINVSAFPAGSTFAIGSVQKTPDNNGIITLDDKDYSGDGYSLQYTIPKDAIGYSRKYENDDKACAKELYNRDSLKIGDAYCYTTPKIAGLEKNGGAASIPVQIITDNEVFSSGDEQNLILNQATGSEPGSGNDKNDSTYNAKSGALQGSPYANNDWSRVYIRRNDDRKASSCELHDDWDVNVCFSKQIYQPYSGSGTIYDTRNKSFTSDISSDNKPLGSANNEILLDSASTDNSTYSSTIGKVSQGTEIRTQLTAEARTDFNCSELKGCRLTISDSWDNTLQRITSYDDIIVWGPSGSYQDILTGKITPLDKTKYTVQYLTSDDKGSEIFRELHSCPNASTDGTSSDCTNNPKLNWKTLTSSTPDSEYAKITSIRIILQDANNNDTITSYKKSDTYKVSFKMKELAKPGSNGIIVPDYTDGSISRIGTPNVSARYQVVGIGVPKAKITNKLKLQNTAINTTVCDQTDSNDDNDDCIANPGYTAYYTGTPSYSNIAYSDATMSNASITISDITPGLINFVNDSTYWNSTVVYTDNNGNNITLNNDGKRVKVVDKNGKTISTAVLNSDGSVKSEAAYNGITTSIKSITFTPNTTIGTAVVDDSGNGSLPVFAWHATVSNRATGENDNHTIVNNAEFKYNISKANAEPAYPNPDKTASDYFTNPVTSDKAPTQMSMNTSAISDGMLTANHTVEVNDNLTYDFNIYARGSKYINSTDNNKIITVLRMPSNNNDANMAGADRSGKTDCTYTDADGTPTVNKDNYPGLDCSWHEYDRGVSHYEGSWKLASEPVINQANSTNVEFMYAVGDTNDKNSDKISDYTWKHWSNMSDADKTSVHAIMVITSAENTTSTTTSDNVIAAANGTITITPTGSKNKYNNYNHSGDTYVTWIGRNYAGKCTANTACTTSTTPQNTQPWADADKVIAGSISGTAWWDDTDDGYMDDNEPRIPDAQIQLYHKTDVIMDENGKPTTISAGAKPVQTMMTWTQSDITNSSDGKASNAWQNDYENATDAVNLVNKPWKGGYKFIELHSGDYIAVIKRADNAGKTDGNDVKDNAVPKRIDASQDYYNTERTVSNTYIYNNDSRGDSILTIGTGNKMADASDTATVPAGGSLNRVDFGYYAPHPLVSLNKQLTNTSCVGTECKLQWAITIKNDGNTTISKNGAKLTDNMSSEVKNVTAFMSTLKKGSAKVFTDGEHSLVLSNGKLITWGYNRYGQASEDPGEFPQYENEIVHSPVKLNLNNVTSADTGSMHTVAIANGHVYTWGLNTDGQLGDGYVDWATDQVPNPHPLSGDVDASRKNGADVTQNLLDSGATGTPVQIAAGADYTIVIMSDGSMWATQKCAAPTTTPEGDATNSDPNAEKDIQCAADTDGKVKVWKQVPGSYSIANGSLSAYGSTVIAIKADGTVVYNTAFSSSNKDLTNTLSTGSNKAVQVAAGFDHVLALDTTGKVYATGGNDFNQKYGNPSDTGYVSISAGYMNSMAVKADGTVYAWGLDMYGSSSSDDYTGYAYENGNADGKKIATASVVNGVKANVSVDNADNVNTDDITRNANIIAAGYSHALFSTDSGEVKTAGLDAMSDGQNIQRAASKANVSGTDTSWDVYKIGTNRPSSIGKAKVYGSDYVDTDNLTPLGDCVSAAGAAGTLANAGTACINEGSNGVALVKYGITLPYDLPAGNQVTIVLEGTVSRNQAIKLKDNTYQAGAGKYVVNQAWFTSSDTPFDKTPNARAHATNLVNNGPKAPSESVNDWDNDTSVENIALAGSPDGAWNASTEKFAKASSQSANASRTGTNDVRDASFTCRAGYNFGEANEHWYGVPYRDYRYDARNADNPELASGVVSASNEDMCDQQATVIEGFSRDAIFGSISGIYWNDYNLDGIRESNETSYKKGQEVTLWSVDDNDNLVDMIAKTQTDKNGAYKFDNLPIDQSCAYSDGTALSNGSVIPEGTVIRCSSLKYQVVFSTVVVNGITIPFTKTDVKTPGSTDETEVNGYKAVGDANGNGAGFIKYGSKNEGDVDSDSDAIVSSANSADADDKNGFASFTVQWLNVDSNQVKPHVDAGYGKAAGTLPFTGMRWLLLVIAIIVITACIIGKFNTKYTDNDRTQNTEKVIK